MVNLQDRTMHIKITHFFIPPQAFLITIWDLRILNIPKFIVYQDACKFYIAIYRYQCYPLSLLLPSQASHTTPSFITLSPQISFGISALKVASHYYCSQFFWTQIELALQLIIKIEVMLNPIKHLGGRLNHLHIPQTRYLRIIELANSIRPSNQSKSLEQATVDQILALRSSTQNVDARSYHKFQFELQVHTESSVYALPSTIYDDLNPHQRKISHLISTYTSRLNSRQLLYLNLAFRRKINGEFPGWNTLHLCEKSPSKVDLQVLPTLTAASRIPQLKSLPKKVVMKEVIKAKKVQL